MQWAIFWSNMQMAHEPLPSQSLLWCFIYNWWVELRVLNYRVHQYYPQLWVQYIEICCPMESKSLQKFIYIFELIAMVLEMICKIQLHIYLCIQSLHIFILLHHILGIRRQIETEPTECFFNNFISSGGSVGFIWYKLYRHYLCMG